MVDSKRREDGRQLNEMRRLKSDQGGLFRADGSARMAHGNTAVLAAVYGPGQAKSRRSEQVDCATIYVSFLVEKSGTSSKEKEYELIIRQTFEPLVLTDAFPRAVISIVVQAIEDDGSLLSVAINTVNLALIDAGVPMKACVTAATCAIQPNGNLCLDPSLQEEDEAIAVVTNACAVGQDGLLTTLSSGPISNEQYLACSEACSRVSTSLAAFVRLALQQKEAL